MKRDGAVARLFAQGWLALPETFGARTPGRGKIPGLARKEMK